MYISACDQIHIDHATDTSVHVQASVLCTISTPGIYISGKINFKVCIKFILIKSKEGLKVSEWIDSDIQSEDKLL